MLMNMAYTQADLDNIKAAIAQNTLSVRSGDDSVTYRSLDEMIRAKELIESELASASTPKRMYPRYQVASFSDE